MSKYQIRLLPKAHRYFKSLKKNKSLRNKFELVIEGLLSNPLIGEEKKGDLSGIFSVDFRHNNTMYEIAYTFQENQDNKLIIIILAGTRENFYRELKNYIRSADDFKR